MLIEEKNSMVLPAVEPATFSVLAYRFNQARYRVRLAELLCK
jgi:hypothetical protein